MAKKQPAAAPKEKKAQKIKGAFVQRTFVVAQMKAGYTERESVLLFENLLRSGEIVLGGEIGLQHQMCFKFNKNMIWNDIRNKKPLAHLIDGMDGRKSDKVLVCTLDKRYFVAEMYEETFDSTEFCGFYDEQGYEIENVRFWAEIEAPF